MCAGNSASKFSGVATQLSFHDTICSLALEEEVSEVFTQKQSQIEDNDVFAPVDMHGS